MTNAYVVKGSEKEQKITNKMALQLKQKHLDKIK